MRLITRRRAFLGLLFLGITGIGMIVFLATPLGRRVIDIAQWRYMVTFKVPIQPVSDYSIVVNKQQRDLSLYRGGQLVRKFKIAISKHGPDPRKIWADELTPEGTFLIASMQYNSAFGPRQMLLETTAQSLVNYLAQYGEVGKARLMRWEDGHGPLDTIWEVYDFNEANADAPIWNDILIHGGGSGKDWTWGCVALNDADVLALFDLLHESQQRGLGVPVTIVAA